MAVCEVWAVEETDSNGVTIRRELFNSEANARYCEQTWEKQHGSGKVYCWKM
jgi:hypothetical protein